LPQVLVADVATALAQRALPGARQYTGTVLGVAGSNGKTTTKEMLAAILAQRGACLATRGNLNNHLGVPLTLLRLAPRPGTRSSKWAPTAPAKSPQLVALARPAVGLITNAGAEHLEGFGSSRAWRARKARWSPGLAADGVAVINADDEFARCGAA
jgi:UDP-N-acetylmuramoyl-tripeptide--D-alanyl-D-alanine ligase